MNYPRNINLFDNHFSCSDVNIRKEYVKLVEDVRDAGGEVKIFSSMHISGQRKSIKPHENTKMVHNIE